MAQTTTVIFLVATLLMAATIVSGQELPNPIAPSPTVDEVMNCAAGLTVCVPTITGGGTPSQECCTAIGIALKTQITCLCGFIKSATLVVPFNVTAFSALLSQNCGIDTDPNLCSQTSAQAPPSPTTTAPIPGPPKAGKNAASKLAGTGLIGIVLTTMATMFY